MWPSTRAPPTSPSASAARAGAPRSQSPTTASGAQTPPSARGSAGWRTASRLSTAASTWIVLPSAAPASGPRSPAPDSADQPTPCEPPAEDAGVLPVLDVVDSGDHGLAGVGPKLGHDRH